MEQLILTKFNKLPDDVQQQVLDYIEFLANKYPTIYPRKNKEQAAGEKADDADIPERLRIAEQFEGTAPYPNMPTSKYECYEQ